MHSSDVKQLGEIFICSFRDVDLKGVSKARLKHKVLEKTIRYAIYPGDMLVLIGVALDIGLRQGRLAKTSDTVDQYASTWIGKQCMQVC